MRVKETERDYNRERCELSGMTGQGRDAMKLLQKMGRAEFQTQLIHLSLRLKRGDKGTKGGQWV